MLFRSLRGDHAGLRWDADTQTTAQTADTYSITLNFAATEDPLLEFKPRLDGTWSLGPNYRVKRGETLNIYPHFVRDAGRVTRFRTRFVSSALPSTRNLWLYTPPTALENRSARFPVVYMHDGLNLFDPAQAFGGVAWEVDAALDRGAADGSMREAYVVGIESSADRLNEMTPTRDASEGFGGRGELYLDMIEGEIKPLADAELRTLPGRDNTAIIGSSLGGLISAWAGLTRGAQIGRASCRERV